jgi:hypothetical protein
MFALIRILLLGALTATAAAIVLGRWSPPPLREPIPRPSAVAASDGAPLAPGDQPTPQPSAVAALDGGLLTPGDNRPFTLDLATGQLGRLSVPEGERFDKAGAAPWRDPDGRTQLVGRWLRWEGLGTDRPRLLAAGLARFSFPDGEPLDRIETDALPVAPPCWSPAHEMRVLLVGRDGRLYALHFGDRAEGTSPESQADRWLQPVPWEAEAGGAGEVSFQGGVAWPTDRRLGGRLLVGAVSWVRPDRQEMMPSRLWWLRLDAAGVAIEAAGRLTPAGVEGPDAATTIECHPAVGAGPGGELLVAYLVWRPGGSEWRLRIATVALDARTPALRAGAPLGLREDFPCLPVAPVFSPDGRWIHCVEQAGAEPPQVRRLPLSAATPEPAGLGTRPPDHSSGHTSLSTFASRTHSW